MTARATHPRPPANLWLSLVGVVVSAGLVAVWQFSAPDERGAIADVAVFAILMGAVLAVAVVGELIDYCRAVRTWRAARAGEVRDG